MTAEITRIRVGDFEFGRPNNAYVVRHGAQAVLIDTGVGNEAAFETLRDGFAPLDVGLDDVTDVLLTHWHADHAGLSGRIQTETGATIHIHEADAPMVQRDEPIHEKMGDKHQTLLREWGVPKPKRDRVVELLEDPAEIHGQPADVEPFSGDRTFEFGDLRIESRPTPGHTAGHSTYVLRQGPRTLAFVGDTILPKLTPNIGGSDVTLERPLQQYRRSLDRLKEVDPTTAKPGHDDTIQAPFERCEEILAHHAERERSVLDIVREAGRISVWDISTVLFDELRGVQIINGTGEVVAHLSELEAEDLISWHDGDVVPC